MFLIAFAGVMAIAIPPGFAMEDNAGNMGKRCADEDGFDAKIICRKGMITERLASLNERIAEQSATPSDKIKALQELQEDRINDLLDLLDKKAQLDPNSPKIDGINDHLEKIIYALHKGCNSLHAMWAAQEHGTPGK